MSKKGGSSGNQTVTQQNIPDWAMNYAQNTLDMGRYYTNNQKYRPSTLDRDYSGIRGYNAQGQPNSQVGQFGLNPSPAEPGRPNANDGRPISPFGPPNLDNLVSVLTPAMQTGGPLLRAPIQVSNDSQRFKQPQNRAEMFEMARTNPDYAKNMDLDQMFGKEADQIRQKIAKLEIGRAHV